MLAGGLQCKYRSKEPSVEFVLTMFCGVASEVTSGLMEASSP